MALANWLAMMYIQFNFLSEKFKMSRDEFELKLLNIWNEYDIEDEEVKDAIYLLATRHSINEMEAILYAVDNLCFSLLLLNSRLRMPTMTETSKGFNHPN
jgi:hypothetical protein